MRGFTRSIVETIRHPLVMLDVDSRVRAANAAFYRAFGLAADHTIGVLVFELEGGAWNTPDLRRVVEGVQAGAAFDDVEVRQLPERVLLLNAHQVWDDDGTAAVLLSIDDVTEKVHAQEDRNRSYRGMEARVRERTIELEVANKELEAFCYSVSHDLRAPLRAISGFGEELLRISDQLDSKGRHYLQRIHVATQRMGELIDDLLRLSQISRGRMMLERVELAPMARAIADELARQEPQRHVAVEISPALVMSGDPGLLRIVLENLIGNAWKFTARNPAAAITIGQTDSTEQSITYYVRDNGVGFDMKHATQLFGAFQRLQREFPGHGIGLATVQRIIHRHGGKVWAASTPGLGTTFFFTLPSRTQ